MIIGPIILLIIIYAAFLGVFKWGVKKGIKEGSRAFLTGSQVYGNYRSNNSDFDIVILTNSQSFEKLKSIASTQPMVPLKGYYRAVGSKSIRIKQQNVDLIVTDDWKEYCHWKRWTDRLQKEEGLTRAEAVTNLKRRRACRGSLQMFLDKTRLPWISKPSCNDLECWYCNSKPLRRNNYSPKEASYDCPVCNNVHTYGTSCVGTHIGATSKGTPVRLVSSKKFRKLSYKKV